MEAAGAGRQGQLGLVALYDGHTAVGVGARHDHGAQAALGEHARQMLGQGRRIRIGGDYQGGGSLQRAATTRVICWAFWAIAS